MKFTLSILVTACFFYSHHLLGQDAAILKRSGEEFLAAQKYSLALDALLKYEKARPGESGVACDIGVCYFHLNQFSQAGSYLNSALNSSNHPPPTVFLYLGKWHHVNLEFEKAAGFYKQYLQKIPDAHPLRASVKDDIRRCATGMQIRRRSPFAAVVNLGEVVNATGDDFKPILSPNDPERLYFSSCRPGNAGCAGDDCKADMFFTELKEGDWASPRPLSVFLNSVQHEVALDFGDDGAHLYFFRGETLYSGDILVDTFRKNAIERTLFAPGFNGPMRPWEGDRAPYFFQDTILLFASRRTGGYGGLDLYISTFEGEQWTFPQNLGPTINSAYDETSPFLARDGRTLYFSSNDARRSMGGLDILKSTYLDHTQRWSPPENLGIPLNSAEEDQHFALSAKGTEAFFASSRRQGLGERDLYVALFDQPRPEQAMQSLPIAFHLVPAYRAALKGATEAKDTPEESFFDEVNAFELPTLAVPNPGLPLPEESLKSLKLLALLMRKFPDVKVLVAIHTASNDDAGAVCQNAFRRTELLLRQEGAVVNNLVLCCAGPSWPLEQKQPETNRRMEFFIANPEILPFKVYQWELPLTASDARFFQKTMSSLGYQVEVEVSGESLNDEFKKFLRFYPNSMLLERPEKSQSFLALGFFLSYATAEEWRRTLEKDGYRHARIVAYLNGWEISKKEAAQYLDQFPDLKSYVEK